MIVIHYYYKQLNNLKCIYNRYDVCPMFIRLLTMLLLLPQTTPCSPRVASCWWNLSSSSSLLSHSSASSNSPSTTRGRRISSIPRTLRIPDVKINTNLLVGSLAINLNRDTYGHSGDSLGQNVMSQNGDNESWPEKFGLGIIMEPMRWYCLMIAIVCVMCLKYTIIIFDPGW